MNDRNISTDEQVCEHEWKRCGGDPSVNVADYFECTKCGAQELDLSPWDRDFDE